MIARSAPFLSREVAAAVTGALHNDDARPLQGLATDTRDPLSNQLFVALSGARFDAHDFLAQALAAGAGGLLVSESGWARVAPSLGRVHVPVIVVQDTLRALGDLAHWHRGRRRATVLALTGSNGKTTTKEMVAAIQAAARPCLKTEGNLNNLIGLPLTLLGIEPEHRVAVIEMGMNQPQEIARYTEIAVPDAGMVLNIGPAHLGELGSIEAVAAAKGELFEGLPAGACSVINQDDPRVVEQAGRAQGGARRTFGTQPGVDVRLVKAEPMRAGGQRVDFEIDGAPLSAELPLDGAHNALNAAGAVALATSRPDLVPVSLQDVAGGLSSVRIPGGRLAVRDIGGLKVIDDCYNANRASMQAALQTAATRAEALGVGFVALLGEMRELGSYSDEEHAEVGRFAARLGAKAVAGFGPQAAPLVRAAAEQGTAAHHEAEDEAALFRWAQGHWSDGDVVLVKGSRGIRMERFLRRIEGED